VICLILCVSVLRLFGFILWLFSFAVVLGLIVLVAYLFIDFLTVVWVGFIVGC